MYYILKRELILHFELNNAYNRGLQLPMSGFWSFYPVILILEQYQEGIGWTTEVTYEAQLILFSHRYSNYRSINSRLWILTG